MKAESNNTPDCQECGFTIIEPENFLSIGLIEKYSGFLIEGSGGISASALALIMDLEEIPKDERPNLCQDIILYLSRALNAQRGN